MFNFFFWLLKAKFTGQMGLYTKCFLSSYRTLLFIHICHLHTKYQESNKRRRYVFIPSNNYCIDPSLHMLKFVWRARTKNKSQLPNKTNVFFKGTTYYLKGQERWRMCSFGSPHEEHEIWARSWRMEGSQEAERKWKHRLRRVRLSSWRSTVYSGPAKEILPGVISL